jgi:LysM repeat protein
LVFVSRTANTAIDMEMIANLGNFRAVLIVYREKGSAIVSLSQHHTLGEFWMNKHIVRIISFLAAFVFLFGALLQASPVSAEKDGSTPYVVRGGDNLTEIARMYGLTVERIMASNPQITDPNLLITGQVITLPSGRNEGPRSLEKQGRLFVWQLEKGGHKIVAEDRLYRVKSGDSFARIAKAYGLTEAKLLAVNPQVEDTNTLFRGELLHIPYGLAESVPLFYFTPNK